METVFNDVDGTIAQAMQLMNSDERMEVEKEAVKIQTNVRAWLLQRNYKSVRQSVTRLQAVLRGFMARRSYEQTRAATTTLQAVTRGLLARKEFAAYKQQAAAALIIQRSLRSWYTKMAHDEPPSGPGAGPGGAPATR